MPEACAVGRSGISCRDQTIYCRSEIIASDGASPIMKMTGVVFARGELVYREPRIYDLEIEAKVMEMLDKVFDEWQAAGWIPGWRIEPG